MLESPPIDFGDFWGIYFNLKISPETNIDNFKPDELLEVYKDSSYKLGLLLPELYTPTSVKKYNIGIIPDSINYNETINRMKKKQGIGMYNDSKYGELYEAEYFRGISRAEYYINSFPIQPIPRRNRDNFFPCGRTYCAHCGEDGPGNWEECNLNIDLNHISVAKVIDMSVPSSIYSGDGYHKERSCWWVEDIIEFISNCDLTISESLDGLVVSHVYGVPSLRVNLNDKINNDFREYEKGYLDYLSLVGIEGYNTIDCIGAVSYTHLRAHET